jgi:uncharacterized phiE125 gp8 family phage protein
MQPIRTIAPAAPLVSLIEAKAWVREISGDEDAPITGLVAAAEAYLDGYSGILGRCIQQQTWRTFADAWGSAIRLPFPEAQASAVVRYYDPAGAQQVLSSAAYRIANDENGGFFELLDGVVAPDLAIRPDAIWLEVVFGFAEPPASLKVAVLFLLADWFDNREGVGGMPASVKAMIEPFRFVSSC